MSTTKKYLITHSAANTSVSPVGQILGVSADNIKLGVNLMATDVIPSTSDILEFPNVGITAAHLTDAQVKQLRASKDIVAVEEDLPMHILEIEHASTTEDFMKATAYARQNNDSYNRGYNEGIQSIVGSMGQGSTQTVNPYQPAGQGAGGASIAGLQQGLTGLNPNTILPRPFPFPFPTLPTQPIPWNISMVKAPAAWARGITGAGIRLAIIDTGIAAHVDLPAVAGGVSFVPGVVSYNDDNGHGTHCAGIAAARNNFVGVVGVAPGASLYAVKVLNGQGSGNTSDVIAGMDWAAAQGMHVVSMSLGGLGAPSAAYSAAVKRLQDRGTVVVTASGNSFGGSFPWVNSPGNSIIPGVPNASPIAVGAVDMNKAIASFSSRGGQTATWNQVAVVAPGVSINSTIPGNAYGIKSGTSMATPHVAGAAVLIKQRFPGISAAAVRLRLMTTAGDLGAGGYDQVFGSGLINCDLATL